MAVEQLDEGPEPEYYHIWCEECCLEEFLPFDIPISGLAAARHELCECEETQQRLEAEKEEFFVCEICDYQGDVVEKGGFAFCPDCAEEVGAYTGL